MKNTLDAIHNTEDAVTSSVWRLRNLARAFRATGNAFVAEQLEFEAETLETSVKQLPSAWNKDLDAEMMHSNAMLRGIIQVAISPVLHGVEKENIE